MQKVEDVKTALALKFLLVLWIFAVLILTLNYRSPALLRINNSVFRLDTSYTSTEMSKGLSGVQSMPNDQGMLFVFSGPLKAGFWMKQMKFNLDIIWLNNRKEVVYIEKNLSPSSYPKTYCPNNNSIYVLEMNSGFVDSQQVFIGEKLNF